MTSKNPCEMVEPLLSAHVLGEVAGDEARMVKEHLAGCPACSEEARALSATAALVSKGAAANDALKPADRAEILAAASRGPRATPRGRGAGLFTKIAFVAASIAAAVVAGVFVGNLLKPKEELLSPKDEAGQFLAMKDEKAKPAVDELAKADSIREIPMAKSIDNSNLTEPAAVPEPQKTPAAAAAAPAEPALSEVKPLAMRRFSSALLKSDSKGEGKHSVEGLEATDAAAPADNYRRELHSAQGDELFASSATRAGLTAKNGAPGETTLAAGDGGRTDGLRRLAGLEYRAYGGRGGAGGLSLPLTKGLVENENAGVPAQDAPLGGGATPSGLTFSPASGPGAAPASTASAPKAPVSPGSSDWKARVDEFLTRLDRRPGETPEMMFFRYWGDNPFYEAQSKPLSTFGADVDTASYTLARSYLYKNGVLPPREAVRTEEFINYFKSRYAPPTEEGRAFTVHAEIAPSPFSREGDYKLLKLGIKAREVSSGKRKACSLVFVVDTSGSMRMENRLELVKEALKLLVKELDEGDTIGIVAFDHDARTILEPAPASAREKIIDAISALEPRHNTNVAAGLDLGFKMADSHRMKEGSNRVILLSDGVANTGILDANTMLEQIRGARERGVFLTCVGVGMGNHNDALLEQLADRGNGQCIYVDRMEEAKKVFSENLTGTLETIAKDVKIQVELNPEKVIRYRLLGYEKRALADSAFRDNSVDAGEVGAGHEVTALYELKLKPEGGAKIATVRVRSLTVEHGEAVEMERQVTEADARAVFADASPRFQLTACVAAFAEVLRDSYWARKTSLERVSAALETLLNASAKGENDLAKDADVLELAALVKKADALVRARDAAGDEVARTVEALKDNIYLRARIDDEVKLRGDRNRNQLEDLLHQNDDLRRRLEEMLQR